MAYQPKLGKDSPIYIRLNGLEFLLNIFERCEVMESHFRTNTELSGFTQHILSGQLTNS